MKQLIVIGFLISAGSMFAQTVQCINDEVKIRYDTGEEISVSGIGKTRIVFKDGSIKKNCVIKEIKQNFIVYLKDGVLHDAEISKLKWIELDDGIKALYFDENNKPLIKYL